MNGASRQVRRAAAALAVAASLGFGAAQALAAPVAEAARACNPKGCNSWCQAQGGFEGRCSEGACLCLY